jgi:LmbE family N-acetylglucosaminyl deacetylase
MTRRTFLGSAAAACLAGSGRAQTDYSAHGETVIERAASGKPHAGKVLAAIQPHCDDIPLFAGGTVAKLLDEGYTGHLIRTTNDDSAGAGSVGTVVPANERDNAAVARVLGLQRVFNLNYPNHNMDGTSRPELRGRLIFLFRLLQVDTVICYDPWGRYEENPDHYVTASCVEAACWMAAGDKDYPEHFAAGLKPHSVREKYYFARFDQKVNRVVDIGNYVEKKIDANLVNVTQGPAGENGARLRRALAEKGQRLSLLGDDDRTANREYIRQFVLSRDAEIGAKYGLKYAEQFHYIGLPKDEVGEYLRTHGVAR